MCNKDVSSRPYCILKRTKGIYSFQNLCVCSSRGCFREASLVKLLNKSIRKTDIQILRIESFMQPWIHGESTTDRDAALWAAFSKRFIKPSFC